MSSALRRNPGTWQFRAATQETLCEVRARVTHSVKRLMYSPLQRWLTAPTSNLAQSSSRASDPSSRMHRRRFSLTIRQIARTRSQARLATRLKGSTLHNQTTQQLSAARLSSICREVKGCKLLSSCRKTQSTVCRSALYHQPRQLPRTLRGPHPSMMSLRRASPSNRTLKPQMLMQRPMLRALKLFKMLSILRKETRTLVHKL